MLLTAVSGLLAGAASVTRADKSSLLAQAANAFDVVQDRSIPTWFSSLLLLVAALTTYLVYTHLASSVDGRRRLQWLGLAAGLLFMSIDETATLHERLNGPLQRFVTSSAAFAYPWVIVAIPLVAVLAITYWPWLEHLDHDVRSMVILGGALFVAGAVGLEMIGAALESAGSVVHGMVSHAEEMAEMLGIVVFIEAMVRMLFRLGWDGSVFSIGSDPVTELVSPG